MRRMIVTLALLAVIGGEKLCFGGELTQRAVWGLWGLAPVASVLALFFAWVFFRNMMKESEGTETMASIASYVREGALAYIKRQYKVVALFFVVMCAVLSLIAFGLKTLSYWVPFAFLTGGFFSGLCGYLGMRTATYASARTANSARSSLSSALRIAFRSGAVMGLVVVGFGLVDICLWFLVLYKLVPILHEKFPNVQMFHPLTLTEITVTMLCFGVGASTQALFARVGGGIYTKAADVGADLVGKVEAGIPEDDPRNPAVIADNVGDNVGDVAGMGADLYESYCGSILSTMALGVAAASSLGASIELQLRFLFLPMIVAGIGIVLSVVGIYMVRSSEEASMKQLMNALNKGIFGSSIFIFFLTAPLVCLVLPREYFGVWGSIVAGLVAGVIIGKSTEYYTSHDFKPTRNVAARSVTGPATVCLEGLSVGLLSTWIPVISVVVAMVVAFALPGGFQNPALGFYGVGIAAVGMLSTLGITLATDAYGPIADNAGGNAEMSKLGAEVRERTDALDALGNTTAATGKGFAIGSAALTALALLVAYIEELRNGIRFMAKSAAVKAQSAIAYAGDHIFALISDSKVQAMVDLSRSLSSSTSSAELQKHISDGTVKSALGLTPLDFMTFYNVNILNPKVLAGMFIGGMTVFVFCSLTIRAVGRAAGMVVEEVRRQFREIPGLLQGEGKAEYARCVEISTRSAQREMVVPSLLAVLIPIVVGLVFGAAGVMGLLSAGLAAGFVTAVLLANSGATWDNAKKYIEKGNFGSKGSEAHKASVVCDTIGDPFKDTSGPSLNILLKLMSMVSVVFAGVTVKYAPKIMKLLGIL